MSAIADYLAEEGLTVITPEGGCSQCRNTKKQLDVLEVPYTEVVVEAGDEEMRNTIRSCGFSSFPVVSTADESVQWCGFNPMKVKAYQQSLVKKKS